MYDKRSQDDTWAVGRDHNIAEGLQISWFGEPASMNDFGNLGRPTGDLGLDNVQTTLRQRVRQRFGESDRFGWLSGNWIRQLGSQWKIN